MMACAFVFAADMLAGLVERKAEEKRRLKNEILDDWLLL